MKKIMRKNHFKIQMLAGNSFQICVGGSSQISTTLVATALNKKLVFVKD